MTPDARLRELDPKALEAARKAIGTIPGASYWNDCEKIIRALAARSVPEIPAPAIRIYAEGLATPYWNAAQVQALAASPPGADNAQVAPAEPAEGEAVTRGDMETWCAGALAGVTIAKALPAVAAEYDFDYAEECLRKLWFALYVDREAATREAVTDEMVEAAEAAVYPRHERGFLSKPLVGAIDMRKALEAALAQQAKPQQDRT